VPKRRGQLTLKKGESPISEKPGGMGGEENGRIDVSRTHLKGELKGRSNQGKWTSVKSIRLWVEEEKKQTRTTKKRERKKKNTQKSSN